MVDRAIEGMNRGVVAVGLTGDERNPLESWVVSAFRRAKDAGLGTIPHAGEIAGAESIRTVLLSLAPERIAHGVRCTEDAGVVALLRDNGVALDVCPTSNVSLRLYPDIVSHPLRRMIDSELKITISTDDPSMFNTTLTSEYLAVCDAYGLGANEVEQLALNGVRASLLADGAREAMEARFKAELAQLRVEHGV